MIAAQLCPYSAEVLNSAASTAQANHASIVRYCTVLSMRSATCSWLCSPVQSDKPVQESGGSERASVSSFTVIVCGVYNNNVIVLHCAPPSLPPRMAV